HHYPEAILTLGKLLYTNGAEPVERLKDFLTEHKKTLWLFESLAREQPRPSEKEETLVQVAGTLPVADAVRSLLAEHRLEQQARTTEDSAEIERLYHLQRPDIWRALA